MSNYQTTNFNNSFTVMAHGAGALTDCCSESHRQVSYSTPLRRQDSKQNGSSDGATRLVGYGQSSSRLNLEYAGTPLPFAIPSCHDACQPTHAVSLKRSTTRVNTEEEFCHVLIRPELGSSTRTPAMPYTPPSAADVDERQQQHMNIPKRRGRLVRKAAVQAQAFMSAAINEGVLAEEIELERGEDCRRRPPEDAKTKSSTPWCGKEGPTEEEWGAEDGSNVEEEEDEDADGARWPLAKRCKMAKPLTSRVRHSEATLSIMRHFWRSKGVSAKLQLEKLVGLAQTRRLYADPSRIDIKLQQLRTLLPGADVVKIVSNVPNLLVYDLVLSIPPKVAALQRILPRCDIIKILVSSPHLLTFNIEANIAPKIQHLRRLLPGANIVKIVSAAPNLLSYDVEGSLTQKVQALFRLLPGADVIKLISYAPTLLYHDTEASIAPKLRALASLLPGCDVTKMVCAAPPLLCSDIEGSIARKLLWMREMVNGSVEEVYEKIESNPRLLTCGYGVVFGRLEFIFKNHGHYVPIKEMRGILLAPVSRFERECPDYAAYLAQQLVNAEWAQAKGRSVQEILEKGVKHLEREYGNCLRHVVNKN